MDKLLKSVATVSGKGLHSLGPSHTIKKPKVPPSALAAAALAQKMMAMPSQEGEADEGDGAPKPAKARSKADDLDPRYYTEDFDPVLSFLHDLPEEGPEEEWLKNAVKQKMAALDIIGERLSRQVMQHHDEMVQGMGLVTELERDLQVAAIIAKNARRALSTASAEVTQDLVVTANVKRKQVLVDMLPTLLKMQAVADVKSRLQGTVDERNFARALRMCSECLVLIDSCQELVAIQDMSASIQESLRLTVERVDAMLMQVAKHFEPKAYAKVIDAYAIMDDSAALGDKLQTFFAQHIVSETHDVLKTYCFMPGPDSSPEDPSALAKKSRLPYNDLCTQLAEAQFRPCLYKTLEVLFDLLSSYRRMMDWQYPEPEAVSSPSRGRHLDRKALKSPPAHFGDSPLKISTERPKASEVQENGKVSLEEANSPPPLNLESARLETVETVKKAMDRGRKTVWELAARRVAALLASEAICSASPHHFLQALDWTNKFILAGEAFSGAEAHALRARLARQSEKYFKVFHRQNMEVLRMMIEKESWTRLPASAFRTVSLVGLTGSGAPLLHAPESTSPSQQPNDKGPMQTFQHWMAAGNPFAEGRRSQADREATLDAPPGGPFAAPQSNGGGHPSENGTEEEESEELMADFIDEDSQRPSSSAVRRKSNAQASTSAGGSGSSEEEEAANYTAASISILRYMDKYARLMQILQPIAPEVFKGLCQLFDFYFFTIFRLFGQKDTPKDSTTSHLLTPRLRSTITRITAGLEELRTSTSIASSASATPATPAPPFFSDTPHAPPSLSNPSTLKERVVAVESASSLAGQLAQARPRFTALLPQSAMGGMDHFYARTVEAVPDLREHVYKTLARLLLNVSGYTEKVAGSKWEIKELGMQHNSYVDQLISDYRTFSASLAAAQLPKQVSETVLENARDGICEALVEGYSRVKRCTNEGRALMSLDLQVLINGLQQVAPNKMKPNMTIVENYIKAFYLPETEFLHWSRTHPEYTQAQKVAIVTLVANMNNWKRKTRVDLIEKIESGDMG